MEATTLRRQRVPQHLKALALANRIRLARAEVKRRVAAGDLTVSALLRDQPFELLGMKVSELLRAQYRWGRWRARTFLAEHVVSENRELGKLTLRQREALAQALDGAAARQ